MMIGDSNGSIVPIKRDLSGAPREPVYCGLANVHRFAVGLRRPESPDDDTTNSAGGDDCKFFYRHVVILFLRYL